MLNYEDFDEYPGLRGWEVRHVVQALQLKHPAQRLCTLHKYMYKMLSSDMKGNGFMGGRSGLISGDFTAHWQGRLFL